MNIFSYVYDYISILFENEEAKELISKIIIFGSITTGEFNKESDIDIFIDTSKLNIRKVKDIVKENEKRFYLVAEKKWEVTGIRMPIATIVGDLEDSRWKELKYEIMSTGIIIYGKYETLPKNLKHYALFTYSLANLPQTKKMKLLRNLFGYITEKGKKKYRHLGLIDKIKGKKLGSNTVLIPIEKSRSIQKFFNLYRVTPEIREIWTR